MKRLAILLLALAALGCKKKSTGPNAKRVWLGPEQGCIAGAGSPLIGTFACWGVNDAGQLDATKTSRSETRRSEPIDGQVPAAMTFGAAHACALLPNDAARCFGANERGQLGPSGRVAERARAIAAGGAHTCWAEGAPATEVRCVGADDEGQIGAAPWEAGAVLALAAGQAHTCAALERGSTWEVRCRGRAVAAPRAALPLDRAPKAMVAGDEHTCVLAGDGGVRCWGRNDRGQLGDGSLADALTPVAVVGLRDVVQIAAGRKHTCARLANGSVACWGDNRYHQLANGTVDPSSRPVGLRSLLGVVDVAAGGDSACAVLGDGYVRCWGRNDRGQLGDGSTVEHDVPMPLLLR